MNRPPDPPVSHPLSGGALISGVFARDQAAVWEDFTKCYEIANYLSSLFPEAEGSWTGTVSQRIDLGVTRLTTKIEDLEKRVTELNYLLHSAAR